MRGLLLDTCVISELRHPKGNPSVKHAIDSFHNDELHVSVLTLGEIAKGINLLPPGRRRDELAGWLGKLMDVPSTQLLPVTREVSVVWGRETARAQARGQPQHPVDLLLAATALVHGLTVCTRNTSHFVGTGVPVYDPWQDR